ncbi:MAG: hypothetical protein NTW35_03015 [Candidatus Nomurabacteria bacterium]|nr:hypothetical protein [Candidatus Nomurabacteria bacterium]
MKIHVFYWMFFIFFLSNLFLVQEVYAIGSKTIDVGGSAKISWEVTNASNCTAQSDYPGNIFSGSQPSVGSITISNATAGNYTFTCTELSSGISDSVTLTVNPAPVTTCTDSEWQYQDTVNVASWCSANAGVTCTGNKHWGPTMLCHGNINTHTYSAFTRGTSCDLVNPYCDCPTSGPDSVCVDNVCGTYPSPANATPNNTKTPPANNLEPWTYNNTTPGSCTYTCDSNSECIGNACVPKTTSCPNGATDAACTPAPTVTATIDPTTAVAYGGGFKTLIYTTKNATSCTGQQTGGVVSGPWATDAWDGSHSLTSGSYTSNVTWTFTCTNAGKLTDTAQVTLYVNPYVAPVTPIVTSSFTPSVITSDGSTLYTFRATDADHCIVTHPDGTGTWDTTTTYFPPTTYFASLYPTGLTTTVSCNYQGGTYVASTATLTVCAAGQNVVANTCVTPSAYNCGVGTGIPTGDNITSNSTATGPNQNWAYDGVGTAACTWTCKTGFKKSGNTCVIETITCPALNTGSYTSSSGTCTYSFNKAAGAIVGDTTNSIALTSPAGYTGSLSEKCQSNGTWANNIGTCTSPTSGVTPPGWACNPLTQDVQVDCDNITGNTVTGQLIRRQTAKADCTFPSVSTSDPIIKNTCAWTCNNGSPFPTSCPSPVITSISLSGNNTPDGTINFTCTDTQSYTLTRDGIAVTSGAYTGPTSIPLATFGSIMGYYTVKCLSGGAAPGSKDLPLYDPKPLTTDAVTLDATPLTLKSGTPTALNWSINIPDPGCTIIALPVCPGGSCNPSMDQNRITYANNLSSQLLNGQTDINDPYGYRPMTTALRTKVVGLKAIGKKSFNLQYTTEFLLDCHINVEGRISPKKYLRVQVTNDNEG